MTDLRENPTRQTHSLSAPRLLRVGLMLDGLTVPAWIEAVVNALRESDGLELALILPSAPAGEAKRPRLGVFQRYMRFEARKTPLVPDATASRDCSEHLSGLPLMRVGGFDGVPHDLDAIRALQLDVLIRLGDAASADLPADVARLGLWSPAFGPSWSRSAEYASFWAVVRGQPVLAVRWVADHGRAAGCRSLGESHVSVDRYSVRKTLNPALWSAAAGLKSWLRSAGESGDRVDLGKFASDIPTNARALPRIARHMARRWRASSVARFAVDEWILMYQFDASRELEFSQFRPLVPPPGRFWADPFAYVRNGRHYIFFEEAVSASGKGRISVIEVDNDGRVGDPIVAIEQPYHLSYPFLIEWHGELYMIPETAEAGRIEAYRCVEFPHRWEKHGHLIEGIRAYDSTLLHHEGRWWMFANVCEHDGASSWENLHLFYADHPLATDWVAHPMNPVVSDVRQARPAGNLFWRGGQLFRPSQNSAHYYGYGLNVSRVTTLSTTDYREEVLDRRDPDWNPAIRGVHTLNRAGRIAVIDALYHRRRG